MEKVYKYATDSADIFENLVTEDDMLINHVVIPAGKLFPKHPSDADVYMIVVKGEVSLKLAEKEEKKYKKGDMVNFPKNTMSELGNKGKEPAELFVVKRM